MVDNDWSLPWLMQQGCNVNGRLVFVPWLICMLMYGDVDMMMLNDSIYVCHLYCYG